MALNGRTTGRHFKRSGASIQGTLSNWVSALVHRRLAEQEKFKINTRAWDLYLNDAMAHGIIEGLVVEAVNTGMTPQPHPMIRWIGKDAAWQNDYQQKAYDLFEIWGLDFRNFCDATRRCNIYMLQALAFFQWKLEGIGLFQNVIQKEMGRPLGLSVLPIDPGRLVTPWDATGDIYDGLELDSNGAVKKAWILRPDRPHYLRSAKQDDCIGIDVVNAKTGMPNILTVCDVRNVSEYRQDSILGSMIKEIKDSNDFVDAALVKSLIQNLWTAFVTSDAGSQGHNVPTASWEDRIQEMEKGTMIMGRPGEVANFMESKAPGPNYDIMNNSIISRLGMATGRGAENVSRSYKASYSASRASIENASRFDDSDRMVLTNCFCQPVYAMMQYEGALRGILPVDSMTHFKDNLYAYTRTDWMPPPLRPIDHQKEAKADTERLSNGTKNYSTIFGAHGQNWRVALRQTAIERQYIKGLEDEFGVSMAVSTIPEEEPVEVDGDTPEGTDNGQDNEDNNE